MALFAQHHALIGRWVRVEATDRTFASGVLYCVDPASDAVVLLRRPSSEDSGGAAFGVKVFLGHSVAAIRADDEFGADSLDSIRDALCVDTGGGSAQDVDGDATQRRARLCELLTQSFVPWTDEGAAGVAVFGGAARVRAPFTRESVESANEQILARLQQLLANG
ncbi:hypothetical protein PybrP1_001197 [[Pythium] brassicae (nom. inval.)]|nr:hypothetical protein PybrP1_001197 [[Pythium] brassicae (nom. inval.)]